MYADTRGGLRMKARNDVEVLINGNKYTISGFESDEYLQKVATYINEKYTEFKKKEYYNNFDFELRNILLAINMADDFFKMEKKAKEQSEQSDRKDKQLFNMKHEIVELKEKLEEAEKQIEELKKQAGTRSGQNRGRR